MAFKLFKKDKKVQVNNVLDKIDNINKKYYLDLASYTIIFVLGVIKTVKRHEINVRNLEEEIKEIKSKGE